MLGLSCCKILKYVNSLKKTILQSDRATENAIFMRCLTSTRVHGGQSVHSLSEDKHLWLETCRGIIIYK